jgi:hypothetical protein
MAKNAKPKRNMNTVGQSQRTTESTTQKKFAQVEDIAKGNRPTNSQVSPAGRISPQLSCTIEPEDKALLNELTLYLSNKAGKILNTSTVIRSLIRHGSNHKDRLET